jgi:serine/threonine-protein kinase
VEGILPSPDNTGAAQVAFSASGTLVYVSGKGASDRNLAWVDRKGTEQPLDLPSRSYRHPRLSPDGQRVLLDIDEGNKADIWVHDFLRGTLAKQTHEGNTQFGSWTPDGSRVVFQSTKAGPSNVYWKTADIAGGEERLTTSENFQTAGPVSRDGSTLIFTETDPMTGLDIWTLPLKGERKPQPFVRTPFNEGNPAFSPDGRWLAYQSDESGRDEIYVQPFPGPGTKAPISSDGGTDPLWSRDGRELFYRNGDKMMSVPTVFQPAFRASKPELLFVKAYWLYPYYPAYDVSPDGRRFLMVKENEQAAAATAMNVVLNWFEEVKQKAPAKQ